MCVNIVMITYPDNLDNKLATANISHSGAFLSLPFHVKNGWLFGNNDTVLEQPINFAIIIYLNNLS